MALDFELIHNHGTNPCGGPAFQAVRKPWPAEIVKRALLKHLDGSEFLDTDPQICGACHESIALVSIDVEPV